MSVKYGKFEMPQKITVDSATATPTFARVTAEPFERGLVTRSGIQSVV